MSLIECYNRQKESLVVTSFYFSAMTEQQYIQEPLLDAPDMNYNQFPANGFAVTYVL